MRIHVKSISEFNDYAEDECTIRIEDYFDLSSFTDAQLKSICTDTRVLLMKPCFANYGYAKTRYFDSLIVENATKTYTISELRKELRKLHFKSWQIKSEVLFNEIRVAILYVDLKDNTNVIKEMMGSFGWEYAAISDFTEIKGFKYRVMTFDPVFTKDITSKVKKGYLYHWTKTENAESILEKGIEPRAENKHFNYVEKVHLIKGDSNEQDVVFLGWQLYEKSDGSNDYTLLRINSTKLPDYIHFYGDSRCKQGVTTPETIPAESIEVFAKIAFKGKKDYHGEQYTLLAKDDTLKI